MTQWWHEFTAKPPDQRGPTERGGVGLQQAEDADEQRTNSGVHWKTAAGLPERELVPVPGSTSRRRWKSGTDKTKEKDAAVIWEPVPQRICRICRSGGLPR